MIPVKDSEQQEPSESQSLRVSWDPSGNVSTVVSPSSKTVLAENERYDTLPTEGENRILSGLLNMISAWRRFYKQINMSTALRAPV